MLLPPPAFAQLDALAAPAFVLSGVETDIGHQLLGILEASDTLDANEQGALKKAIKDEKLPLPPHFGGPPMGERPPGPGGPRP